MTCGEPARLAYQEYGGPYWSKHETVLRETLRMRVKCGIHAEGPSLFHTVLSRARSAPQRCPLPPSPEGRGFRAYQIGEAVLDDGQALVTRMRRVPLGAAGFSSL